jgi:ABC-type dipeptide transport system, periplasmic component
MRNIVEPRKRPYHALSSYGADPGLARAAKEKDVRRILASALVACLALAGPLFAQAKQDSGAVVLRVGEYVLDTQMANRNPFARSGTWNMLFDYPIVYEPILFFNPQKGRLEGAAALAYEWSADFKTLTLTVNGQIKWHDGQPLTAADIAFTLECLQKNPPIDGYGIGKQMTSISTQADKVKIALKAPNPSLPNYLSTVRVVPKHIWADKDPVTYTNQELVGDGPFKFVRYNMGTDIQFEANKDYWRGAPKVDKLIVQIYSSAPNMALALLKGDIQSSMNTMVMPSIPEFLSKAGAKMQLYAGLTNYAVLINNEKPLLSDPAVRQALARAVNQAELIAKGEYNGVFPTSPGWLPDLFGEAVSQKAKQANAFDLAAAKKTLEDAGYKLGADKVYQKAGQRLSFTYYNASGAPAQQMEAGMIQQWLLNLGVEIIPKIATWPELTKIAQEGKYDLIQLGVAFPPDPYAALNSSFNSSMTAKIGEIAPGTNYCRYRNPKVDALLAQYAGTSSETKRNELLKSVQDILASDVPFIPMYNSGGHIPYYDRDFTGWATDQYPIWSAQGMISISKK